MKLKRRLWQILRATNRDDVLSRFVNLFIILLVIFNVIGFMLQTVKSINDEYGKILYWFEVFSVSVFTIEYLSRLWACSTEKNYRGIFGRIRFMLTPMMIIDLLAIIPFYLPFLGVDLRIVRILRIFRIFRIFKIGRYYSSLQMIKGVFSRKKEELVLTTVVMIIMLLISATLMYYSENEVQPDKFSSIPESLWWSVITLTTVGYGDVFPVTAAGKFFCAVIAILGIGFFALPVSIISAGFIEEIQNKKNRNEEIKKCPHCGKEI